MKHIISLLLVVILSAGCAASTRQIVRLPDQSVAVEDPTKARIYVFRPAGYFGAVISMKIKDGDRLIGETGPQGCISWEREPGDIVISGISENKAILELEVKENEVYYVAQMMSVGILYAQNHLKLISAEEGQKLLRKCRFFK